MPDMFESGACVSHVLSNRGYRGELFGYLASLNQSQFKSGNVCTGDTFNYPRPGTESSGLISVSHLASCGLLEVTRQNIYIIDEGTQHRQQITEERLFQHYLPCSSGERDDDEKSTVTPNCFRCSTDNDCIDYCGGRNLFRCNIINIMV